MFVCYRGMAESHYAQQQYREAAYAFHEALRYDATSLTSYYYYALCLDAIAYALEEFFLLHQVVLYHSDGDFLRCRIHGR